MKKIIFSTILFLGLATAGFAQQKPEKTPGTPEERAQKMTDMMDKKLSLTADQKTEIYKIHLERAQAMGTMKNADRTDKKAHFEASNTKILNVLNDSQKAEYNKLMEERKEKMANRDGKKKANKKK